MHYLAENPGTPPLYKSGVVYENPMQMQGECEEARVLRAAIPSANLTRNVRRALDTVNAVLGGERFRDIGRALERGKVDCDNLACWRAAELRQKEIEASPLLLWRDRLLGGTTYHALVVWPWAVSSRDGDPDDGLIEDPSLLLGMGGADRAEDRANEIRKNKERCEVIKSGKIPAPSKPSARLLEAVTPTKADFARMARELGL